MISKEAIAAAAIKRIAEECATFNIPHGQAIIQSAIERAFNEGHEQGMDDEAMVHIRQKRAAQPQRSEPLTEEQRIASNLPDRSEQKEPYTTSAPG